MIVVDANVLIRFVVEPVTVHDREMAAVARELFQSAQDGILALRISDAVLVEVTYVLTRTEQYGLPRQFVVETLLVILLLPTCQLDDRPVMLHTLQLWIENPKLEFVDCLVAAQAMHLGSQAATFDRRLQRLPGLSVWPPCLPPGSAN